MNRPEVREARQKLYDNLRKYASADPNQFIVDYVKGSIERYVEAFNL